MPKKITVTLLASILICGCSDQRHQISRTNGNDIQRPRFNAAPRMPSVVADARRARRSAFRARRFTDIDHPGNVIAVLGGGSQWAPIGALNIAVGGTHVQ